ncbi:MAG: intradiol ring-cleavage dioxygenase [Acidobacteriia bacterium]|nr:intradiol ring-cleavage dioxygenase [Terriglobia bacterium]
MKNLDADNVTEAVVASFRRTRDERLRRILESLVRHLHGFAREVRLTPAEWKAAIDFLYAAGRISDERRNEFVLASDVLGLSALVDLLNRPEGATESSELGPFYNPDSPWVPLGADIVRGAAGGERVLVRGRVTDTAGRAIAGALLDFWQAAPSGLYPAQDPAQPADNLRGRMRTDEQGRYAFVTVKPGPYTVPYDGPVGALLRAGGRDAWRPAHFHFIVSADGHVPVVTELFPADDPHLEKDAVFGVRASLVFRYVRHETAEAAAPYLVEPPFYSVDFDFRLAPA